MRLGQPPSFVVNHFAGKVVYDVTDFMETNRDILSDDVVSLFHKSACSFPFATHLFATELRVAYSQGKNILVLSCPHALN